MTESAQVVSLPATRSLSFAPQSLDEALRFADMMAKSNIVPKDYQNNPGNILVAIQWGAELGLQPLQAMQNIAVINGRPAVWGDALLALVQSNPLCEYVRESLNAERSAATCKVKRRGQNEHVVTFSVADAQKAGLWGKQGPWQNYPQRMLQMRARAWALRDVFADVLKGMAVAEEVQDIPATDVTGKASHTIVKEPDQNAIAGHIAQIEQSSDLTQLKTRFQHSYRWARSEYGVESDTVQRLQQAYDTKKVTFAPADTAPAQE